MRVEPRFFGLDTVMADMVLTIERLPVPGGDSLASTRMVTAGGGFNAMSAAVRQGMDVTYLGQLGQGPFADIARQCLLDEGIEAPIEAVGELDLGICIVLVESDGERSFVTSPGAEGTVRAEDLAGVKIRDGDYVSFSGYDFVYSSICAEMLKWLRTLSSGVVVAFDPGPRVVDIDPVVLQEVLGRTDWLLCNETEAEALTGSSDEFEAARILTERTGSGGAVVRCGERGCVVGRSGEETLKVSAVPTVVVDTNGAGDVHNGVFIAELARGTSVVEALERANVASALAISILGPATCPSRDVVSQRWALLER